MEAKKQTEPNLFTFKNNTNETSIKIKQQFKSEPKQKEIGNLKLIENVYVEKLHGTLFNKQFILDPIWIQKTKVM